MRATTFLAAALPIGISALPAPALVEDRGLINDVICLPYNIIVNNLLKDPLLVPFCGQYINIASTTVTTVVNKPGGVVTITSPITVDGGGPVTITNMATVTTTAAANADVTSWSTVSVTVPTATTAATCLRGAIAAPTKVKRGEKLINFIELPTTAPAHRRARPTKLLYLHPTTRGEAEAVHTAALPWKRSDEQPAIGARFLNLLGGLLGGAAPAPAPAPVKAAAPAAAPAPAPVPAPAPAPAPTPLVKGALIPRPAYIPLSIADSALQIICNCANIPAQTVTVTSVGAGSVVTVSPTVTVNARSSVSITKTTTITSAAAAAKTVTSTTTTTIGSTATSAVPNGLVYKKFTSPYDGYNSNAGFTADKFKGVTPDFTGVWSNLNFATPYWPSMSVDETLQLDQSAPFDATQAALLFEGFFIAPQTGTYTFTVPAENNDNFAELWTGSAALSWADSAAAFKAIRTSTTSSSGQTTATLNAGDAMPFTYLWANGGGAGRSAFSIVFPDGSSPTDFSTLFVRPCDGTVFSS